MLEPQSAGLGRAAALPLPRLFVADYLVEFDPANGAAAQLAPARPAAPRPRPRPVFARPRPFPGLLDRHAEMDAAVAALLSGLPVEFVGPDGCGKSTLLRGLAHHGVVAAFPDGVVSLTVGTTPAGDVLQALADRLVDAGPGVMASATDLTRALQGTRALVLLDDVRLDRSEIEAIERCAPDCTFVWTASERRLRGEGRALAVGGLPPEAAASLLARSLEHAIGSEEAMAAAALVTGLGGDPQAVLQAGALARLEDLPLGVLAGTVADTEATDTVIERLLDGLEEGERRVAEALAAMDGAPLGVEHLASLAEVADTEAVLDALLERRLVRAEGAGVRLVRAASEAVARRADLTAHRGAAAAHLGAWAEAHAGEPERVAEEAEALMAALSAAARSARWKQVLRLGHAVETAFALSRRWGRWEQTLALCVQAAQELEDREALAWALHQQGTRSLCRGEPDAAATLRLALALREARADAGGAAVTRQNLGLALLGTPATGEVAIVPAPEVALRIGDDPVHVTGALGDALRTVARTPKRPPPREPAARAIEPDVQPETNGATAHPAADTPAVETARALARRTARAVADNAPVAPGAPAGSADTALALAAAPEPVRGDSSVSPATVEPIDDAVQAVLEAPPEPAIDLVEDVEQLVRVEPVEIEPFLTPAPSGEHAPRPIEAAPLRRLAPPGPRRARRRALHRTLVIALWSTLGIVAALFFWQAGRRLVSHDRDVAPPAGADAAAPSPAPVGGASAASDEPLASSTRPDATGAGAPSGEAFARPPDRTREAGAVDEGAAGPAARTPTVTRPGSGRASPRMPLADARVAQPAAAPVVQSFEPSTVDFGSLEVGGGSATRQLVLANRGARPLQLGPPTLVGGGVGEFAVRPLWSAPAVPPGARCSLSVAFRAAAEGPRRARVFLDVGDRVVSADLLGEGARQAPVLVTPARMDFGDVEVGAAALPRLATIRNRGGGRVLVQRTLIDGTNAADYRLSGACAGVMLGPGEDCTITVAFRPLGAGSRAARLQVTTSAGDVAADLAGSARPPTSLSLSPRRVELGRARVGGEAVLQVVTVTNRGRAPTTIRRAALDGPNAADFRLQGECVSSTLTPGRSCTFVVVFAPAATGGRSARLVLETERGVATASLSGTGARRR